MTMLHRTRPRDTEKIKICLISTSGGHLAQLATLADATKGQEAYLVTVPSPHTRSVLPGLPRFYVRQVLRNPMNLLINAFQSLRIILRERPRAVITTGAGDALPTVFFA